MSERLVSEIVDLSTPDGVADAFVTRPAGGGPFPGVVLYMDAFGIRAALKAHAERLASHGYVVLVPNVFYRDGRSPVVENIEQLVGGEDRESLFAALLPKIKALTTDAANADSRVWVAYLRDRADVWKGPIGTVGYCIGGRLSLRLAGELADEVGAAA